MKKLLVLFILILLLVLTVTAVYSQEVKRGGLLRVTEGRQGVLIKNFNPFSPQALQSTLGSFYETLVVENVYTGEILPWLAHSYSFSGDLKSITFHLRPDVYWNDGEKFTASDVLFTLQLGKEDPALDLAGIWQQGLKDVKLVDDYTFQFIFHEADTIIISRIASIYIVPEHIWQAIEEPSQWTGNVNPVGTGPFLFEEGSFREFSYRFQKNPNYWQLGLDGQPLPYIDGVEFVGATSNEHGAMMIIRGEVDWGGYFLANIDATYVAANPEHHHYWLPEGNIVYLNLNNAVEPFSNQKVRKAVAMAINQEEITMIMDSGAIPADFSGVKRSFLHWVSEEARSHDQGFDPEGALEILKEEGYHLNQQGILEKDGQELSFQLYVPTGWTDWITAVEVISEQLLEIGIRARVTQRSWPSPFMDNLIHGDYQISIGYATSGSSPFFQFDNILHSRHYAPVGEAATGHSQVRYQSTAVDEALDRYRVTTDEGEREALMDMVLTHFMADTPFVPLFFNPVWFQYSTKNFIGWPSAEDPYVAPHFAGMGKMLVYLNLKPVN